MDKLLLPPGPKQPAAVQGAWLTFRPFGFLRWCRTHHGETFTLKIPSLGSIAVFTRPQDIVRIFELDGNTLSGGAAQSPVVDFAGDRSLMKLDGQTHREHREILARALAPTAWPDGGEAILESIREAVSSWPLGRRFDLGKVVDRLALRLVSNLALGGGARRGRRHGIAHLQVPAKKCAAYGVASQSDVAARSIVVSSAPKCHRALSRFEARSRRPAIVHTSFLHLRPDGGCLLAARNAPRRR